MEFGEKFLYRDVGWATSGKPADVARVLTGWLGRIWAAALMMCGSCRSLPISTGFGYKRYDNAFSLNNQNPALK